MATTKEKTPEQIATEAAAAKAAKEAKAAEAKAAKEAKAAEAKAAKEAAAAAKAKAKAEKEAAAAAAKAAKVKVELPKANGVTRPNPTGSCGKVWALADQLSAQHKRPVSISELMVETQKAGLNDATTRTQYARWKAFHGITGVVSKPAAPVAPAVAA